MFSAAMCGRRFHRPQATGLNARRDGLKKLIAEEWEYELRESPLTATFFGDYRHNDKLDDFSIAETLRQDKAERDFLRRLEAIDATGFPEQEQLNKSLSRAQIASGNRRHGAQELRDAAGSIQRRATKSGAVSGFDSNGQHRRISTIIWRGFIRFPAPSTRRSKRARRRKRQADASEVRAGRSGGSSATKLPPPRAMQTPLRRRSGNLPLRRSRPRTRSGSATRSWQQSIPKFGPRT